MKILNLRLKNLNSLYGEWFIDFNAPEYVQSGVFAILGNTGAGKTTILDAICLSLYRQTPRLGLIGKSGNEIMAKGTAECMAEVEFLSNGKRYRATFSQHKAHGRANGKLVDPVHEITDCATNKVICSKLSETQNKVAEITGLTFVMFSRSSMLAQGRFDSFLNAKEDDKSDILESITGTEIYSEISKKVYEICKIEETKLKGIKENISSISLMSPEEKEVAENKLEEVEKKAEEIDFTLLSVKSSVDSWQRIKEIEEQLKELKGQEAKLKIQIEAFQQNSKALQKDRRVRDIEKLWTVIQEKERQKKTAEEELKNSEIEEEKIQKKFAVLQDKKEMVTRLCNLAQKENEDFRKISEKVSQLDIKLNLFCQNVEDRKSRNKKAVLDIEKDYSDLKEAETQRNQLLSLAEKIEKYRLEHKAEEELIEYYSTLEYQINVAGKLLIKKSETEKTLEISINSLKEIEEQTKKLNKAIEEVKGMITSVSEEIDKNRKKFSEIAGPETLETLKIRQRDFQKQEVLNAKIISLEEERKHLIAGNPCPLCGAVNHPYEEDDILEKIDDFEKDKEIIENKITILEHLNKEKEELQKKSDNYIFKNKENRSTLSILKNRRETAEKDIENCTEQIKSFKKELEETGISLKKYFDFYKLDYDDYSMLKEMAEEGSRDARNALEKAQETKENLNDIKKRISMLNQKIEEDQVEMKETETALEQEKKRAQETREIRNELFGEKNLETERIKIQEKTEKAVKEKETIDIELSRTKEDFDKNSGQSSHMKEVLGTLGKEICVKKDVFVQKLREKDIESEEEFLSMLLSDEERENFEKAEKDLEQTSANNKTRKEIYDKNLKEESNKVSESLPYEELVKKAEELKEKRGKQADEIYQLKSTIERDQAEKQRKKTIIEKYEKQNAVYKKWQNLNNLIGSADGKRFRKLAQGITFGNLISHANEQLEKMSDRYIMVQGENNLDLNVIDNYQNAKIRTVKNLSGGESFIVSLSLALGLSAMSGKNISVNSLFLDEGFGTLRGEPLEKAIDALCSLNREGKIIGIISHVERLRERIGVKIEIEKNGFKGHSTITGPGCRKIGE